ncbi:DUF4476 domain-containing protein [Ferruginibacter sp. HRS2-29]|uniref:DUF4476 domain-containing protein n=1 Tax=Ferruginibacter sp. HRS2-29 TaxID=2487334 RepID=UPI0020CBD241|nr:DUF4476 domain-containing protein [Ferruginibacter sp. HRS2-29]MCP9749747.1 DUF4476 domain-containing protein [Ferruginibacter sp. HRS2-29]
MQRKLLCLIAAFFIVFVSFAQKKANMIFFTPNEEKFYLIVNGIQQNAEPMSNVKITDMSSPMVYNVKVRFDDSKLAVINDKVSLEPGTEKSWSIQAKKKKNAGENEFVIKTAGEIDLDETPSATNFAPEQVIVYHTTPLPNINADGVSISMNVNEQSANVSFNVQGGTTTSTSTSVQTSTTTTNMHGGGYCRNPMDAISFRQQLERVRSQGTAAGRKIIAEKIAQTNCLTSSQVYELCDAMYMNADKMALAKYSYTRSFDPQNYEEVFKALPTNSMVQELNNYIESIRNSGGNFPPVPPTPPTPATPVVIEYVPGYNGPYGCPQPMSRANFASAKSTIDDADFENTKLSTAKTIVESNCVTTDQVVEICKLFDFENSKLEFAKFAYAKTYDKGNYFKVAKVFDFDASKQELNKYLKGK